MTTEEGNTKCVSKMKASHLYNQIDEEEYLLDGSKVNLKSVLEKIACGKVVEERELIYKNKETFLHKAMKAMESEEDEDGRLAVAKLIDMHPGLVTTGRDCAEYQGQTPLHIAICRGHIDIVEKMTLSMEKKQTNSMTECSATGTKFEKNAMLGELPLSVAALTLNTEMFETVFKAKRLDILAQNFSKGDNILHSLIKYSHLYPDKEKRVLDMFEVIKGKINELGDASEKVWRTTNGKGFTPLSLAAHLGECNLFSKIIEQKVYCRKNTEDGVYDIKVYDITEIDNILTFSETTEIGSPNQKTEKKEKHKRSILMMIHDLEAQKAFKLATAVPVCRVIRKKWPNYRLLFFTWWIVHTLFIAGLTYAAIERSHQQEGTGVSTAPAFTKQLFQDEFVTIYAFLGLLVALIYICMEVIRARKGLMPWTKKSFLNPYGNGWFRLFFLLLAFCLIIDLFAASLSTYYENYLLIVAVIIGWFLELFFLRSWRPFSFFTVLIPKVVVKDMLPFSTVFCIEVLAFGTGMYMAIQGSDVESSEEYSSFGRVLFTMAKLMVGIGELENLYNTRHPPLSVIIFIAFVVLTILLMLNALIAIMGETCTEMLNNVQERRPMYSHWILHRLSLILYMESFAPDRFRKLVGKEKSISKVTPTEPRRTLKMKSERVPGSTEEDEYVDAMEEMRVNKEGEQNNKTIPKLSEQLKHHDCRLDIRYLP